MAGRELLQARVAVVGHVEWVDFAVVERLPHPGEILHVPDFWAEAAGGGAVAVVQMTKLTGSALFITALARDHLGAATERQLGGQGVTVHAAAPPRADRALRDAGVAVDVLVHSGKDADEELDPGELDPPPRTVVTTLGSKGGRWDGEAGSGTWRAQPLPGPRVDEYGAGDSFAAGLTSGLAAGMPIAEAVELGSRCGAANMTGRGPYAGQLDLR
jgi:sugar/nucleoside kinase (ribokinase family)